MVTTYYKKALPVLMAVASLLLIMAGSHSDPEADHAKQQFQIARSRAILVALVCYLYETDNGRFPISDADLHWPVDYIGNTTRIYGFDYAEANKDPLANNADFGRILILSRAALEAEGINYKTSKVNWYIFSRSGVGARYDDYDILIEQTSPRYRSFLEPYDSDFEIGGTLFYISDDQIRAYASNEDFDLDSIIKTAALGES